MLTDYTVTGKNFAGEIFRGLTHLDLFRGEKFRGRRHAQFRGIYKIYPIVLLVLTILSDNVEWPL